MGTTAPGYVVVIEGNDTDGQGYSAYSPDLPGCIATGSTYDECVATMREALAGHLEVMREYGDPIPEPRAVGAIVAPAA